MANNELVCPRCDNTTCCNTISNHFRITKSDSTNKNKEQFFAEKIDFQSILNDIEKKFNETVFELENGEYVIKEYCRELRRQVQLAKEVKIYDLEQTGEQILKQIDSFEQDKLENYKNLNKVDFETKLEEIRTELNRWSTSVEKFKVDQSELNQMIDTKLNLLNQKHEIWTNLFKHETLDFYRRADDPNVSNLGQLISDISDRINFKESFCIDLSKYLRPYLNSQDGYVIKTLLLDTNDYVLFLFENKDDFDYNLLRIIIFDENKLFKKEKTLHAAEYDCPIFSVANKICIQYLRNNKFYLIILDENLNEINQFEVKSEHLVGANTNYLFMLSEQALNVYDWSFVFVNQLGPTLNSNEMICLSKIDLFDVKNNRLYIVQNQRFGEQSLKIINQTDGKLIRKENFRMLNQFYIDADNRLIVIESNRIVYLNQDGVLLKQINFVDLSFNSHICLNTNSNMLHLFDEDQNVVLIKKLYA